MPQIHNAKVVRLAVESTSNYSPPTQISSPRGVYAATKSSVYLWVEYPSTPESYVTPLAHPVPHQSISTPVPLRASSYPHIELLLDWFRKLAVPSIAYISGIYLLLYRTSALPEFTCASSLPTRAPNPKTGVSNPKYRVYSHQLDFDKHRLTCWARKCVKKKKNAASPKNFRFMQT